MNRNNPLVTIVTPSYNQGQFIEETIKSVLNQTYSPIQYILVDGGSTDNTMEIVEKYRDKINIIIHEKDEGQSDAINKGFKLAEGELVGWVNSDDILYPDCVENIVSLYSKKSDGSIYYGSLIDFIDNNSKKYKSVQLLVKDKNTLLKKDYSIEGLKSDSQEYHESGFIERYPVDVKKIKKTEPKLFEQDKVSSQNMEYLQKLISFCKENDIEFVAVTTPVPIAALKDYSDNYNAAWKYFGKFFEEQDVEYLNFNTQYFKVFTHDMKAYTDYDGHMNGDAARQYSRILAELLDKK